VLLRCATPTIRALSGSASRIAVNVSAIQLRQKDFVETVLEALSDDLMSYGDLSSALQRLYRWGNDDMPGLEQLLRELRERREQELARYDLDSTVESIREQLQEVVDTERQGIDRKVREAPPENRKLMERLAKLGAQPIGALRDHEFGELGDRRRRKRLHRRPTRRSGRHLRGQLPRLLDALRPSNWPVPRHRSLA